MNQPRVSGVICVLFLAAFLSASTGAEPITMKDLLGSWTCISAVIDGNLLAEGTAKELRLTMTPDRYKTERGDQVLFDSTYTLAASKTPVEIDMVGTEGDLKGKAALGILKLDGDILTMCYVMPGIQRPTAFESRPNSGAFLVVWKRAKSN